MPCPRTQYRNNVPTLRVVKHGIYLKIQRQAVFAQQADILAKHHALIIAKRRSPLN